MVISSGRQRECFSLRCQAGLLGVMLCKESTAPFRTAGGYYASSRHPAVRAMIAGRGAFAGTP